MNFGHFLSPVQVQTGLKTRLQIQTRTKVRSKLILHHRLLTPQIRATKAVWKLFDGCLKVKFVFFKRGLTLGIVQRLLYKTGS